MIGSSTLFLGRPPGELTEHTDRSLSRSLAAMLTLGRVNRQIAGLSGHVPKEMCATSHVRAVYEHTVGFRPAEKRAGGVVYRCGSGTAAFLFPTKHAGMNPAS